jgi:hypothetical protein
VTNGGGGLFYAALRAGWFDGPAPPSIFFPCRITFNTSTSVSRWIGNARRRFPQLTNFHEDERYNWLITSKGYGNTKAQVNSEKLFLERLASIINKRTTFGILEESLNIQSAIQRIPSE